MSRRPLSFTRFVDRVLGVKLTPAQRVLALVAFDGVQPKALSKADREIALDLFGDVAVIPPEVLRIVAMVKGARVGGTWLVALRLLHLGLTVPLERLAAGEHAFAVFVGPDLRLPRQGLRYALGAAHATPSIARFVSESTVDSFVLLREDGRAVRFETLPATRGGSALRGRSLVGVALTEFAFFLGSDFVVNDAEILKAVVPRVMRGGQVLIESTPWAETGELFRLWGEWGAPKSALVAHCPTLLMRGDDEETRLWVEQEKRRDPDNAEREAGAVFLTLGAGMFFDPTTIDAAVAGAEAIE